MDLFSKIRTNRLNDNLNWIGSEFGNEFGTCQSIISCIVQDRTDRAWYYNYCIFKNKREYVQLKSKTPCQQCLTWKYLRLIGHVTLMSLRTSFNKIWHCKTLKIQPTNYSLLFGAILSSDFSSVNRNKCVPIFIVKRVCRVITDQA